MRGCVPPVLEYWSAVWFLAADTHLKQLDRVVSDSSFLTGGVFECDIAYRRSAAVLCMLYKIRCNPMHPLYGALPVSYVPERVTNGAFGANRRFGTLMCLIAAEHHSTSELLFPCQYLC